MLTFDRELGTYSVDVWMLVNLEQQHRQTVRQLQLKPDDSPHIHCNLDDEVSSGFPIMSKTDANQTVRVTSFEDPEKQVPESGPLSHEFREYGWRLREMPSGTHVHPPGSAAFHEQTDSQKGRSWTLWKAQDLSQVGYSTGESGDSTFCCCAVASNKRGFLGLDPLPEPGRTLVTAELGRSVISSSQH
ncbi:hypothetical protein MJG53_012490 [Ovis ammon polii x Ovis aries]|uniref:Uncharacterized protein n=1 Tax=Ovis ammon polii x Ovis aries TaxID=2918886 RepID=A0ACB9UN26_9CETA|nr:hypothetical protein MJG53_012490 [Ovis ammon polii x Ovis aries]